MRRPHLSSAIVLALLSAGCAATEPSARVEAIAIPGDWAPPSTTLALSDPQYVEVVDPPPVLPLGSCESSCPDSVWGLCTHPACIRAHPGTTELDGYIRTRWPAVRAGGTYTCRRNSNPRSCTNLSVHSIGRAIDLMIPQIGGDADNTLGDAVANWLIEHAEYIGVQRVIWDGMYWNGSRRGAHFSPISDDRCGASYCVDHHTNHIHLELSVDGAARRTRFFTEGAPPTTCPIVCYGTAAVAADCSYVDCAATGEVCLTDPVRCGPGAPPEPSEAARNATATPPTVTALAGLGRYVPRTRTRLFDTRTPETSAGLVRSDGATAGPLGATRSGTFVVSGSATTHAAWLNLAAIPAGFTGHLRVLPGGIDSNASSLNYAPGRVRSNAAVVALGTGDTIDVHAFSEVDVVADLDGVFEDAGLGLRTAGPIRVLDTRSTGTRLVANTPFEVDVRAPADAVGVVASLAVIQSGTTAGFLSAFSCDEGAPATSHVNFAETSVSANTIISRLSGGRLCVQSTTAVDLVVDVTGYLVEAGELSYQAVAPVRLLDTRSATSLWVGRLGTGQTIELPIQALPGVPPDVRAATVNVTALGPDVRGYITVFPCGIPTPATSSLNFEVGTAVASLSVSATGSGSLGLFSTSRSHVVVDLLGVWVPAAGSTPTPGPGPDPDEPEPMMGPDDPDAGTPDPDAGGAPTGDAGPTRAVPVSAGCGCSARTRSAPIALGVLAALATWARRRRRS